MRVILAVTAFLTVAGLVGCDTGSTGSAKVDVFIPVKTASLSKIADIDLSLSKMCFALCAKGESTKFDTILLSKADTISLRYEKLNPKKRWTLYVSCFNDGGYAVYKGSTTFNVDANVDGATTILVDLSPQVCQINIPFNGRLVTYQSSEPVHWSGWVVKE